MQGYGDLHAYNVAEAIFVVLYMFVSIGVAAYFVGTSVLLVVENEKKTGAYRCACASVCWRLHGMSYGIETGSLGVAAYFVGTSVL
jgi:hypothetical protein